jgi:anti-sigma regulatory factor (Ser/Thr protein kinase)
MTRHSPCVAADAVGGTDQCWLAPAVEMAASASGNWPPSPDPGPLGWTRFPRVALRTLGVDARSVRAARDFTAATLTRWGAGQRGEDVAIVVSELLTNALRHALPEYRETPARSQIRLGLLQPGPCVLCAVADPSPRLPVLKEPGHMAETGRGLHVIGALADAWGCTTPGLSGKVVWAMFATDPAPRRDLHPRPAPPATRRRQLPAGSRP